MLNVLIVDDDLNLCECLLRLLPWEDMNCNTPRVVHNGLSAWEIVQREAVDFVICDVKMPVMEGTELASLIHQSRLRTKIIFLSAYENFSVARHALHYGVLDYILKPINRESIDNLEMIIRNVNQSKQVKELSKRIFDSEYENQVWDAIRKNDREALEKVFDNLQIFNGEDMLSVGNKMLYILYEYLCCISSESDRGVYDHLYKKWSSEFYLQAYTESRLDYLRRRYKEQLERIHADMEGDYIAAKIKKLADENYSNPDCRVAWIADKMYLNAAYAGRLFSKAYGIGLMDYITECRINVACRQIIGDNLSVNKIAEKVGYEDANYFTKLFRSKMGMAPSEYRKKHLGNKRG